MPTSALDEGADRHITFGGEKEGSTVNRLVKVAGPNKEIFSQYVKNLNDEQRKKFNL